MSSASMKEAKKLVNVVKLKDLESRIIRATQKAALSGKSRDQDIVSSLIIERDKVKAIIAANT